MDEGTENSLHTVDFRVIDDKVIVKARVTADAPRTVLDTGSD